MVILQNNLQSYNKFCKFASKRCKKYGIIYFFVELVYFYRVYRLLFVQKMYIAVAAILLKGL